MVCGMGQQPMTCNKIQFGLQRFDLAWRISGMDMCHAASPLCCGTCCSAAFALTPLQEVWGSVARVKHAAGCFVGAGGGEWRFAAHFWRRGEIRLQKVACADKRLPTPGLRVEVKNNLPLETFFFKCRCKVKHT